MEGQDRRKEGRRDEVGRYVGNPGSIVTPRFFLAILIALGREMAPSPTPDASLHVERAVLAEHD